MKKISAKQQQILDYISSYSLEHGYPPSVREIGAEMGLRSPSTVHAHLKKLQEAGYLEPNEHKSRALTPVSGPSMVPRVPILGRVTAGMPILAVEEHIGYVPFEPAAGGGEYYALRIRGDSMIGVGIMDDDLVIIRQDIQARNGDIVIALLEDEATCKTLNAGRCMAHAGESGVSADQRHRMPDFRCGQGGLPRVLRVAFFSPAERGT